MRLAILRTLTIAALSLGCSSAQSGIQVGPGGSIQPRLNLEPFRIVAEGVLDVDPSRISASAFWVWESDDRPDRWFSVVIDTPIGTAQAEQVSTIRYLAPQIRSLADQYELETGELYVCPEGGEIEGCVFCDIRLSPQSEPTLECRAFDAE